MFHEFVEDDADESSGVVGSFHRALVSSMLVRWLIDPAHAPNGRDLTRALRTMLAWPRTGAVWTRRKPGK
jgi:hypothetical protein